MKTLGEVFDSQFGINLPQQISQGELTQLNINKQARLITLAVKFNGLVERNTLFDTEKLITKTLAYHTVIKPHFPTELFSADYFPQLYAAVRRDIPSINGTLNNAEVRFENNTLTINLLNGGKTLLDSKGFDKALIKLISEEFNLYISVNYTGTFEVEENSEEYKAAIQDAQEKINRENLQKAAEFYQEEVETAEKREEKHAENTTVEIEVRVFAWDELRALADSGHIDAARERLMDALSNYAAFTRREVVVVFDGYRVPGGQGEKFDRSGLHVVFTRQGETADAYMEKLADEIGKNDSVRVVTSDALIQLTALRAGVLRMSAREFRQELAQVAQQLEAAIRDLNGR